MARLVIYLSPVGVTWGFMLKRIKISAFTENALRQLIIRIFKGDCLYRKNFLALESILITGVYAVNLVKTELAKNSRLNKW